MHTIRKKGTVGQVSQAIVKGIVGQQFLRPLALGDVAIDDDQAFCFSLGISDDAGGGFQGAPGLIFVAHAVFQALAAAGATGLLGRVQDLLLVVGMDLIQGGGALQFFFRISQHLLVGWTVIEPLAVVVDDGDHVGGILGDQFEELIAMR